MLCLFSHHLGATCRIITHFKDSRVSLVRLAALREHHLLWVCSPVGAGINLDHFFQHKDLPNELQAHWFTAQTPNSCQPGFPGAPCPYFPAWSLGTWLEYRILMGEEAIVVVGGEACNAVITAS